MRMHYVLLPVAGKAKLAVPVDKPKQYLQGVFRK